MEEVRDLLNGIGLGLYADKFEEEGWDDINTVLSMTKDEIKTCVDKPGHVKKIWLKLQGTKDQGLQKDFTAKTKEDDINAGNSVSQMDEPTTEKCDNPEQLQAYSISEQDFGQVELCQRENESENSDAALVKQETFKLSEEPVLPEAGKDVEIKIEPAAGLSNVKGGDNKASDMCSNEPLLESNAEDNCRPLAEWQAHESPINEHTKHGSSETCRVSNEVTKTTELPHLNVTSLQEIKGFKTVFYSASSAVWDDDISVETGNDHNNVILDTRVDETTENSGHMAVYKAKSSTSREKMGQLEFLPYDMLHDNNDKMAVVGAQGLPLMVTETLDVRAVINNQVHVKQGLEMSGVTHFNHIVPRIMYDKMKQHSRKRGHLSAVYCVLFDRTGEYIFTGADDQLVKVWQASDGGLKATLRGHSAEITDMAVNFENTLLASGSCDKTIRIWCLKTTAPVSVLQGHTGMITSLQFSPIAITSTRYLASTGKDAGVCFWQWDVETNKFSLKPVKYIEMSRAGAQLLCSSFSPGGMFFAAGSTDHVIRMYYNFHAGFPEKIGELEKHIDWVDNICYCHHDNRFLSGSHDGVARIWRFDRSEWRNISLKMSDTLKKKRLPTEENEDEKKEFTDVGDGEGSGQTKLKVTSVGWSIDDAYVVTAVNDFSIKVWCSLTGKLQHVLKAHEDKVYVLEPSPKDKRIMLSAGYDGNIIIWDIIKGEKVKGYFNLIEGQGHGAVFDCKFSPDGTTFCATDSHGHLMIYGFGSNEKYKKFPDAVSCHTDYRPLVRDSNNYVLDEQTQQAPHLMPPPFLVDIDGNPNPPEVQRLVPGREKYRNKQLVPQLAFNEEVAGGSAGAPGPAMVGMRRVGETEGVRQSLGNIQEVSTSKDLAAISRRIVVKDLDPSVLRESTSERQELSERELYHYMQERKKKSLVVRRESGDEPILGGIKTRKKKTEKSGFLGADGLDSEDLAVNRLTQPALYDTDEEADAVPSTSRISKRRLTGTRLDPEGWRSACTQLLITITQCEDSAPFREPVSIDDVPRRKLRSKSEVEENYYEVIERPMDLLNIRQNLESNLYTDPNKMAADMKLMFTNSKSFNTNKRSRIYSMTLRLSAMFESKMNEIITTWRRAMKHHKKLYGDYRVAKPEPAASPAGPSRISDRPFSSLGHAEVPGGLTNGHTRGSDIDVTKTSSGTQSRKRPRREKPSRTKMKKLRVKRRRVMNRRDFLNGSSRHSSSSRYSTCASSGVIKASKYTNEGIFTDEDSEEEGSEQTYEFGPKPSKKRSAVGSDSDSGQRLSEGEKHSGWRSSSSASGSVSSGWETEPHSPIMNSKYSQELAILDNFESDKSTNASTSASGSDDLIDTEEDGDTDDSMAENLSHSKGKQPANSSNYASSSSHAARKGGKSSRPMGNCGRQRVTY